MRVITIASAKGGAGKTTLALSLAVACELADKVAVILDTDPQSSLAAWRLLRPARIGPVVVSARADRLAEALRAAGAHADLAVIDTPPNAGRAVAAAASFADLILIPCRPALFDLRAVSATVALARAAGKPGWLLFNAVPPGARRLIDDARAAIAAHKIEAAPFVLSQRAVFVHALTAGQSAQEFEPGGRAASEIAELYSWIRKEIGL